MKQITPQLPTLNTPKLTKFFSYTGFEKNTIKLGKQVINHDNQRHVGAVGWRQNRQTFDAARIVNKSVENLTVDFAFDEQFSLMKTILQATQNNYLTFYICL